ncbi:MAG: hypothetical protein HGB05_12580 [Chloroflexi bacterium]|nr:hypothetical protein [Chloroflexota bacterium]
MSTSFNPVRLFKVTLGMILLCMLICACAAPANQPASGVTFTVPIQVEAFSSNGTLQVFVWNAEQMAAQDQQGECIISHDMQSGTDTVLCPEGVQYQEITPEKFDFPIQAINQSIQLTSHTVKVGEKYRIALRGLSSDDCNSTSATAEGTATSSTITLGDLDWLTTAMACVTTP